MDSTSSKKIIVFGGSGYIGTEVCKTLVAEEAEVLFTYCSNSAQAKALESFSPRLKGYFLDLSQPSSITSFFQEIPWKEVDGFVQCTGSSDEIVLSTEQRMESFEKLSLEQWDNLMAPLRGTFLTCQHVSSRLKKKGNLLFIGAMVSVKSVPAPLHYAVGKGGLKAMATALAKELGTQEICVNLIAPGILAGGAGSKLSEVLKQDYIKHCSLGRLGTAQEIADMAVWFLLENTYVTGQAILLDGGL